MVIDKIRGLLLGASVALVAVACDEPGGAPGRDEAARVEPDEPPALPQAPDGDGDAADPASRTAAASEPAPDHDWDDDDDDDDRPRCYDDDEWHKNGLCLARCKGEWHYKAVSDWRKVNYKWCHKRAWKHCENHGRKLRNFCWGSYEDWDDDDHDWDDDDDHGHDDDDDGHGH